MDKIVEIEIRFNWGRELAYPTNPIARTFAAIAGKATLSLEVLGHIQRLGFTVQRKVVAPSSFEREIDAVTGGRLVASGSVLPGTAPDISPEAKAAVADVWFHGSTQEDSDSK